MNYVGLFAVIFTVIAVIYVYEQGWRDGQEELVKKLKNKKEIGE